VVSLILLKNNKCSKKGGKLTPAKIQASNGTALEKKSGKLTPAKVQLVNSAVLAAGALAGGALLARKRFKKMGIPLTTEQWRKSPDNVRNKPKLSVEENERIINEAIAGGQKWDVQEDLDAFKKHRYNV